MKKEIYKALTTSFSENMNRDMPWAEYPRPSMVRDSYICLNGKWEFTLGYERYPDSYDEFITVPFSPESALSGIQIKIPKGRVMFYRKSFTLPDGFNKGRVLLNFGAVDTVCEVMLNGKIAATHVGGYLPFSADITDFLVEAENVIEVKVKDEISKIYPYGKQTHKRGGMWYTPVSGIWQTVWLESVPCEYVRSIKITTDTSKVKVEVDGGTQDKIITLADGKTVEWQGACVEFELNEPKLWSPENPNIYRFTLQSGEDKISSYFAMRKVEIGEIDGIPRILLNGKPYLFNGLLDQGYYPDGLFLPATSNGYVKDISTAKELGFNMLRKHIKVEPDIFYYLCDTMGMVVFQDMVNNSGYSFLLDTVLPTIGFKRLPDRFRHKSRISQEIFIKHSLDMMEHLHSHPSILYYTIFNEGWGQFNADKVYDLIKKKDPTRIIDATSGWFTQNRSDVDSRHVYFKPVKLSGVSDKPIVISEFGGYSHRVVGHLFGEKNYGYKIFEDEKAFEDAFVKLYEDEILPQIKDGISALVYTQVSDVEDETNGVLTYDRRHLKLDPARIKPLMNKLQEALKERK